MQLEAHAAISIELEQKPSHHPRIRKGEGGIAAFKRPRWNPTDAARVCAHPPWLGKRPPSLASAAASRSNFARHSGQMPCVNLASECFAMNVSIWW